MAGFVLRATSDYLPEILQSDSPPRLLSPEEVGLVMAELPAAEKARSHRAFYRGQLLNWFFTSTMASALDDKIVSRMRAVCLWATWQPWEIHEILTLHAYFRHQHELLLEEVNSDFVRQLQASAPEYESPDDYFEIRSSVLHPPVSDTQVNLASTAPSLSPAGSAWPAPPCPEPVPCLLPTHGLQVPELVLLGSHQNQGAVTVRLDRESGWHRTLPAQWPVSRAQLVRAARPATGWLVMLPDGDSPAPCL
jgi:hypothetical protein